MTAKLLNPSQENIQIASDCLAAGGLVAIPTETVYGLAADATNDKAVARIFGAKGRPEFNPVIAHVSDIDMARKIVEFNTWAEHLASLFWPGPLTLVLKRQKDAAVSLLCSAGLPTLAVRCPAHPVARDVIKALGKPIAAPSANISGSLSPTTPQHVMEGLGEKLDYILTGGKADIGLESTVVDVSGGVPVLLRAGAVTLEDLQMNLKDIRVETEVKDNAPKSPGQLLRHYAPKTPLRLKAVDVKEGEALLAFGSTKFIGIKGGGSIKDMPPGSVLNLSENGDLYEAAANLFALLHQLDAGGFKRIAVMDVPDIGLGVAINDRLRRAVEE